MWEWRATSWQELAGGAPSLFSPLAAADPLGRGILLVGAVTNPSVGRPAHVATQTWLWNGGWTELHPPHAPAGWITAGMALDPTRPDALLAAGIWDTTRAVQDQLWQWNGSDWAELAADDPAGITGNRVPDQLVAGPGGVYGFREQAGLGRSTPIERWTGQGFVTVGGAPVTVAEAAFDAGHGAIVVLGSAQSGLPDTGTPVDTTYVFDGNSWASHPLPAGLDGRVGATMVDDLAVGGVLLWGGTRSHGNAFFTPGPPDLTTWRWDGAAWSVVGR